MKLTHEDMQRIAEERGGKCLSETYINTKTKLLWQCAKGHQWEATPDNIKGGHWCPFCAGKAKGTIEEMQRMAEKREGKCLSDTYVNNRTKLLWECAKGHQWEATPDSIKRGSWCPYCAGWVKGTMRDMHRIAEERGGKCLSDSYINNRTKLLWECAKGHQWKAIPNGIKRGHWCPYCAGLAKGTIEEMQRIAEKRGGKCLSETYVNVNTKLVWECAAGHQWETPPAMIKRGTWCPYCAGKAKGTLKEMQKIAAERRGKCLSKTYINNRTKILWECVEGHQWEAKPDDIKKGHWCPYCAGKAKGTLEEMQSIAKERGGKCLSETYVNNSTKLLWECAKGHQWEARPGNIKNGRWCPSCAGKVKGTIEDMQKIAEERGGRCLSETYVNSQTKLLWECTNGHQWAAKPTYVKRGRWCPTCGKVS